MVSCKNKSFLFVRYILIHTECTERKILHQSKFDNHFVYKQVCFVYLSYGLANGKTVTTH